MAIAVGLATGLPTEVPSPVVGTPVIGPRVVSLHRHGG